MSKFEQLLESTLSEMGKYDDVTFSMSPEDISEIVTDADSKNKLNDEEKDALETELNDLVDKLYKKYKGSLDTADAFWKAANKIGKAYGLNIKQ